VTSPAQDERRQIERLRSGDEAEFIRLVTEHHDAMLRLALTFVRSHAVAEEVVQDTWLGVLRGIDRFEGRARLRTWLLAILVKRARSAGVKEARSVAVGDAGPIVDASRFGPDGGWIKPPEQWVEDADERLGAGALRGVLVRTLTAMPDRQRAVVMLRDVDGLRADEVCEVMAISAANERVLLHRGRGHLREALEIEIGGVSA
jgi:RNA polymerase sigma-70 factor, ECF subfamily